MKLEKLREIFDGLDRDSDGFIVAADYLRVLQSYAEGAKAQQRIEAMDLNADQKVSFSEFCRHMGAELPEIGPCFFGADGSFLWVEIFKHMDLNKSGKVEISDLKNFLLRVGEGKDLSQITKVFAALDKNADGEVSYAEFLGHFRTQL